MDLLRKDSNSSRPNSDSQKRQDHFRHDAAVHSHHDGPLGVLFHVPGAMLNQCYVSLPIYDPIPYSCPSGSLLHRPSNPIDLQSIGPIRSNLVDQTGTASL
jgi:hypothetical protein